MEPMGPRRFRLRNGSRKRIIRSARVEVENTGVVIDLTDVNLGPCFVVDAPLVDHGTAQQVTGRVEFEGGSIVNLAVPIDNNPEGVHAITLTGYGEQGIPVGEALLEVWYFDGAGDLQVRHAP